MARKSKLDIIVNADTQNAVSGLGKVSTKIGGIAKSLAQIGGAAAVAGFTGAATGIRRITKDSIALGTVMDRVMKTTGATEQELAGLRVAAIQEHASFQTLAGGLKFLARAMEEAKAGIDTYADAFKDAGIDPSTFGDKTSVDIFRLLADSFKGMESESKKVQIAMDVMSRSGETLVPLLNKGSGFLDEMQMEAERAGLVFDGMAAQTKTIDDNFTTLKLKMEGFKLQAFSGFGEELLKATNAFNSLDFAQMGRDIGAGIGPLISGLVALTKGQTAIQQGITGIIQPTVTAAVQSEAAGEDKFVTAFRILDANLRSLITAITGMDPGQ